MADEFGLPPVITPFAVKLLACLNASTARALLGVGGGSGGSGVPDGGVQDALLAKASNANQDLKWTETIDGGYY